MKLTSVTALVFILGLGVCQAADFPAPVGYVNDFAAKLTASERQDLERKLRDYQKATSIQLAVAIVPSLQDEDVETYGQKLGHAWGVGEKGKDNGVLFLWAPTERKLDIEIGYGLEAYLTDAQAGDIIREITPLFREGKFGEGVNAAVDGITKRLGQQSAQQRADEQQRLAAQKKLDDEAAARKEAEFEQLLVSIVPFVLGFAVLGAVIFALAKRRERKHKLLTRISKSLAEYQADLSNAKSQIPKAQQDLLALQSEAPNEVWRGFEPGLKTFVFVLGNLSERLNFIGFLLRHRLADLKNTAAILDTWKKDFDSTLQGAQVTAKLSEFREHRAWSQAQLGYLPTILATAKEKATAAGAFDSAAKLLKGGQATYNKAKEASQAALPNWLLVYDLLRDVNQCLDEVSHVLPSSSAGLKSPPARRAPSDRRWQGSQSHSEAATSLHNYYSSPYSGGEGGGSTFRTSNDSGGGTFGGGDFGGGGASGEY